jgi:hypothetical protein
MKPIPHLALFLASFAILAGCHVTAKAADNITPHDNQPVQPVIVTADPTGSCTNYALLYINWMTGAQTSCVAGTYVTGGSGGGSMVYPGVGIANSTGHSWDTSKATPAGAIVGTTDTQTLTNKTVDGITPTVAGYLDPTSSVQTQLNGKLSSVAIQQAGSSVGSASTLNCSTNLTCTVSGGVATVVATGGGAAGPQGYFATAASNTSTLTVGTDCATGTPCMARVGSLTLAQITASMTATASTGSGTNDTAYIYFDTASGNALTIGDSGTVTLTTPGSGAGSGMVVAGSAITGFPVQSLPLFTATITSDNFTAVTDERAQYSVAAPIAQGSCAIITRTISLTTIGFDNTCAPAFNGGTITNPIIINADSSSILPFQVSSSSTNITGIQITNNSPGGHGWIIAAGGQTNDAGRFTFYDATNSSVELKGDSSSHLVMVNSLQVLAASQSTPPTCDSTHKNTYSATSGGLPQFCDGTAWHTLSYAN